MKSRIVSMVLIATLGLFPFVRQARGQSLIVGYSTASNSLSITNGTNSYSFVTVGRDSAAINNVLTVLNSSTLLTTTNNSFGFTIGESGSGNSLVVSNGGTARSAGFGALGYYSTAASNTATVTGAGSLWTNNSSLYVGHSGSGNQLIVSNGGTVAALDSTIGVFSSFNMATVTGAGSLWRNSGSFTLGYDGSGNQLTVGDGATFNSSASTIGSSSSSRSNAATVSGTGSLWTNNGIIYVGYDGSGNRLAVSNGGTVASTGHGYLGVSSLANSNTVTVTGAGSLLTNGSSLYVGYSGSGNQLAVGDGGTMASSWSGYVGYNSVASSNSATVTGAGSLWANGSSLYVGYSGSGNRLVVSNGGTVRSAEGRIGDQSASSNNVLAVVGPGSLWANSGDIYVGYSGSGNELSINDGGILSGGAEDGSGYPRVCVGYLANSNALTVSGAGALVTNNGGTWVNVVVGWYGSANQLTVSNSGKLALCGVALGLSSGASNNSATITGADSLWTTPSNGNFTVGENGSGNRLVISNGGTVRSGSGNVGWFPTASNNTATVTGAGSLWANEWSLTVGDDGSGNRLVISNGGVATSVWGYIGTSSGASNNSATVTGMGSLWTNSDSLTVGSYSGSGTLILADGGTVAASSVVLGWSGGSGTLNIGNFGANDTGGSLVATTIEFGSGSGVINFNQSNIVSITSNITAWSGYSNNTLNQLGAGTTILSGYNTYMGVTTISAGALRAANSGALGDSRAGTIVSSGASLELSSGITIWNEALGLSGMGVAGGGALRNVEGNNTYRGAITSMAATRINSDAGTLTLWLPLNASNQSLSFGGAGNIVVRGAITNSTNSVAKDGIGTITLAASNSFSGGFTLSSGAVRATHGSAFGTGLVTQIDGTSRLIIDTTQTVTNQMSIFHLQSWQTVTLSGAKTLNNATYDVTNNTTTIESGNLSGSGGVTKLGAGTLILSGSNSYTGAVDVQAGLLELASMVGAAADSASSVTVATDAKLLISQSDQVNNSATVTLSGGAIRRGAGVSEIFGNLNIAAASTLDFGTGAGGNFQFQDYSNTESALVTVQNFLPGNSMQFLTNSFSTANLNQFGFGETGYSTSIEGNYFTITAIPESSTFLAAVGLLGLMTWSARRGRAPQKAHCPVFFS